LGGDVRGSGDTRTKKGWDEATSYLMKTFSEKKGNRVGVARGEPDVC